MKIGPLIAAILGVLFGVGFLVHESPPSTRHVVQGVVVAVPALLLMVELYVAGRAGAAASPYRVLAVQGLAACALAAALADQRVRKGSAWWVGIFLMVVGPLLVSTFELSRNPAGAAPASAGGRLATRITLAHVTGAAWLITGTGFTLIGASRSAPFQILLGIGGLAVAAVNLVTAQRLRAVLRSLPREQDPT